MCCRERHRETFCFDWEPKQTETSLGCTVVNMTIRYKPGEPCPGHMPPPVGLPAAPPDRTVTFASGRATQEHGKHFSPADAEVSGAIASTDEKSSF